MSFSSSVRPFSLIGAALALFASSAWAADAETFELLSAKANNNAELAEYCLTFSVPLKGVTREEVLNALVLEQGEKRVTLSPRDLSLSSNQLCLQKLQHEKDYHLKLRRLQTEEGVRLDDTVDIDFNIPPRKPSLTFLRPATGTLAASAPQLTAVNVKEARLVLYRIKNPDHLAAAWQQSQQASFAPSESVIFAREKGEEFWQSDLVLSDAPNQNQDVGIPLPELPAGLYFLTAAPRTAPSGLEADFKLVAGVWLLRSNLRLAAHTAPDGLFVFASDASAPVGGVEIRALDKNDQLMTKGTTDVDGIAHLSVSKEGAVSPSFVVALGSSGHVAFAAVEATATTPVSVGSSSLQLDQASYAPGAVITAVLQQRAPDGKALKVENSVVRLLRPDQSVAFEQMVGVDHAGPVFVSLPLSLAERAGGWKVVWQKQDGKILTQKTIRVKKAVSENNLQVGIDRAVIGDDGVVSLNIKVSGKTAAYQSGIVRWNPVKPRFSAWPDHVFGTLGETEEKTGGITTFMADADGTAQVVLAIENDALGAARISVETEEGASFEATLPFAAQADRVGVKAIAGKAANEAAFNVVAIDAAQKRRALPEVYYQIYEDSRRFDWYQADGRWAYRPLPQHHRVGGGRLAVTANGDNTIRWPVSFGNYVLEITDADGNILTQYAFQSSSETKGVAAKEKGGSFLLSGPEVLKPNQPNKLTISLKQPKVLSLIVAGDKTLKTIHQAFSAGNHVLALSPAPTWGDQVVVTAQGDDEKQVLSLPVRSVERALTVQATAPQRVIAGSNFSLPVVVQNAKQQPSFVSALITPVLASSDVASAPASVKVEAVPVDREGKATVSAVLPEFNGTAEISLFAWNDEQSGMLSLSAPAAPAFAVKFTPPENFVMGDSLNLSMAIANRFGADGVYTYTITPPKVVKMIGTRTEEVFLRRGQKQAASLAFYTREIGAGLLRLDITGPNVKQAFHWPLEVRGKTEEVSLKDVALRVAPQESWTLKAATENEDTAGAFYVGTSVFPSFARDLKMFFAQEPASSIELAEWILQARAWQETLDAAETRESGVLKEQRADKMETLLRRQNNDGGFSWVPLPLSQDSDIAATAAALLALEGETQQIAMQAFVRAATWLQKRLENPWVNDTERETRAAGYLALAKLQRGDLAALRYYADTIKDKSISAETEAKIALAFAYHKDEDGAKSWLGRVEDKASQWMDENTGATWRVLALLAENPFQDWRVIAERGLSLSEKAPLAATAAKLRTAAALADRAGSWRMAISGTQKKYFGVHALPPSEVRSGAVFKNLGSETLTFVRQEKTETKESVPSTMEARLYQLDGGLLNDQNPLERNAFYILEFSGSRPEGKEPFIFQSASGQGLTPLVPRFMTAKDLMRLYPWLGENVTPWESVWAEGDRVSFVIGAPESKKGEEEKTTSRWRVAYLVRADRSCTFTLPTISLRSFSGKDYRIEPSRLRLKVK